MTYLVTVRAGLLLQVFEGGLQALEFTFTQLAQVVTDSAGSNLVKLTGIAQPHNTPGCHTCRPRDN